MDDSIYKRSIYLFWKRTSPHPMMLAFDAPMRETCSVRRPRTNTPLQSLVTMNEPAFLEAAKFFGSRIQKQPGRIDTKIKWAYRVAFSREPKSEEVNLMTQAFTRYRDQYEADPAGTEKLLTAGVKGMPSTTNKAELAAWMMVASTLINTDEFLTQH